MKLRSLSAVLLTFLLVLALVVPAMATTQATLTSAVIGTDISGVGDNGPISGFAGEFNITLTGGQVVVGFCIDAHTGINTGDGGLEEQSWTGSGIDDLNKVSWILNRYNSSNQTVTGVTLTGTPNQRAAAVQAAIWSLTDGFVIDPGFPTIAADMQTILDAIPTGGLPIDPPPSLSLTPATQTVETGTSASVTVSHNASSPVTVTDSEGNTYAGLSDGDTVSVTSASPMTITLSVTAEVPIATGRVFEHPTRPLQRLITAGSGTASSTASASVTFVDAAVTLDLDKTWDVPQGFGIDTNDFGLSFFESDGQTPVTLPLTVDPGTQVDLVEKVTYVGSEPLSQLCTFDGEQSVSHTTAPFSQWTPEERASGSRSESFAVTNVITCGPGEVELVVEKEWTLPEEYVDAGLVSAEDFVVEFTIGEQVVDGPVSVTPGSTVMITESVSLADDVVLPESCTFEESSEFSFAAPAFAEWTADEQQAGVAARTFTATNTLECGPQVELTVIKLWEETDLVAVNELDVTFTYSGAASGSYVPGPEVEPIRLAPGDVITFEEIVEGLPETCTWIGPEDEELVYTAPAFADWDEDEQRAGSRSDELEFTNRVVCDPVIPPPPPPAPNPAIDLVKVANPTTIELAEGEDATDTVTYTYTVTNTGNRILNNVTIVDDVLGDLTTELRAALGGSSLAVGASVSFSVTQTVGVDDIGTLVNIAIVSGTSGTTTVTAEDDAEVDISQVAGVVVEDPDDPVEDPIDDPVDDPVDDPADDTTEIVDDRETTEVLDVVVERTPRTGSDTGLLILVGLLLAAIGAAALGLSRRHDVG